MSDAGDESTGTDSGSESEDISISEMVDNMGTPTREIECPIDGCKYSNRKPESVAAHVSMSSLDKHIWENTSYAGWRAFVAAHSE